MIKLSKHIQTVEHNTNLSIRRIGFSKTKASVSAMEQVNRAAGIFLRQMKNTLWWKLWWKGFYVKLREIRNCGRLLHGPALCSDRSIKQTQEKRTVFPPDSTQTQTAAMTEPHSLHSLQSEHPSHPNPHQSRKSQIKYLNTDLHSPPKLNPYTRGSLMDCFWTFWR